MSDPSKDGLVERLKELYWQRWKIQYPNLSNRYDVDTWEEKVKHEFLRFNANELAVLKDFIITHTASAVAVAVEGCAEVIQDEIDVLEKELEGIKWRGDKGILVENFERILQSVCSFSPNHDAVRESIEG